MTPKTVTRGKKKPAKPRAKAKSAARRPAAKSAAKRAAAAHPTMSAKHQFLNAFEKEHATTLRVLRAYPPDKLHIKPHAKSKSARDLAFVFAAESGLTEHALTKGFDWSKPMPPSPPVPESIDAIIAAYDAGHKRVGDLVRGMSEERLSETIKFPTAPKTIADVPKLEFLWFLLCDQIHHRGQMSVYLRMADAKVPSIYGPTADEPWM